MDISCSPFCVPVSWLGGDKTFAFCVSLDNFWLKLLWHKCEAKNSCHFELCLDPKPGLVHFKTCISLNFRKLSFSFSLIEGFFELLFKIVRCYSIYKDHQKGGFRIYSLWHLTGKFGTFWSQVGDQSSTDGNTDVVTSMVTGLLTQKRRNLYIRFLIWRNALMNK